MGTQIIINGVEIRKEEVETIKDALSQFYSTLKQYGLGEDEHGIKMTELYCQNIQKIQDHFVWNNSIDLSQVEVNNEPHTEAIIYINGQKLTVPESMALRNGLEGFSFELDMNDEKEKTHLKNITNIRKCLYNNKQNNTMKKHI